MAIVTCCKALGQTGNYGKGRFAVIGVEVR